MPLDDLVSVIETLQQRIRDHGTSLRENETRTRMALIDPLLTVLGWDVSDPALVTPEYNVGGKRADYALLNDGGVVVFLEAKKLDEPLSGHRSQIVAYASELGIKFPALTNGNDWEVYDNSKLVPIDQRQILNLNISNTPAFECALKLLLLWRPNLATGQPVAAEEPLLEATPGSKTTAEAAHDSNESPSQSHVPSGWVSLGEFNPPGGSPPPQAIRFPDEAEHEIKHWNDILVAVATWLNASGKLTTRDVPVQSSPKTYIVHTQPTHPMGNDFFLHRELPNGSLVVNTHGSAIQMRKNSRTLLEYCGASADDVWLKVE